MARPVVLTLTNAYLPGYRGGGPARTILALVQRLRPWFELRVATPDRERGSDAPYPGITTAAWQEVGGGPVFYLPSDHLASSLTRLLRSEPFDLLYLNSFFHPTFTLLPLAVRALLPRVPVLVAPRGELSPGALSVKPRRKAAFLRAARGLYQGVEWHASNDEEAAEITRLFPRARVHVACDLTPELPAIDASLAPRGEPGSARLVFISRIVPKKNLDFAVRALRNVRARVELDVYGPIEDRAYFAAVERDIAALPPNVRVRWVSELRPEDVPGTFVRYDAFLFPTRGENFGHVVIEALHAGCTVIVSDRTPWRGLAARGVGFDLPLEERLFTDAVERVAARDPAARAEARTRSAAYALEHLAADVHLRDNRAMFERLTPGGCGR